MSEILPTPIGRFKIGSVESALCDCSRTKTLVDSEYGRELFIKIWYPAQTPTQISKPEKLWQQLSNEKEFPFIMRLVLRWINRYRTHTYSDLPIATDLQNHKMVIYNHGFISFASDNTALIERLASEGFIVIGIQHRDQLREFKALDGRLSKQQRHNNKQIAKGFKTKTGDEKQKFVKQFYDDAKNTNSITHARALDSQFVLQNVDKLLAAIPGINNPTSKREFIALGLSLGGAVSTEFAKLESSIKASVNMDGGIFGELRDKSLSQPCLMIYSEANHDDNKMALANSSDFINSKSIKCSKHLNFHDIALIFPHLMALTGAIGKRSPVDIIQERNQLIVDFINKI